MPSGRKVSHFNLEPKVWRMKRATHLFTGMLKCGTCGGGFIQVGKQYYGCANMRNKGTCGNRLTIKREEFETRVLSGLKNQLLHPDLIAEYVRAYQAEFNQLAGSIPADRLADERELTKVTRQIDQMVNAIAEGMLHPSMKDKMTALESSKAVLTAKLRDASTVAPVLLHPGLADRYQAQVANLTAALGDSGTKAEATSIIRSLLTEIRLIPQDGVLAIELVGALAGLLSLCEPAKGGPINANNHPRVACYDYVCLCFNLVAGVGFEPTTFRL
jgi:site-specific DNA recombinase